jgi:type IV secretory pathway protease TraF
MRQSFEKGDVVVALSPGHFYRPVCKRISATEGDEVSYVDPRSGVQETCLVPPDHVWLLGDNPAESGDSRHYGPVKRRSVRGRVFAQLWPSLSSIK